MDSVDTHPARPGRSPGATDAATGVTALYEAHASGLIRLAVIMLGDRQVAEDVVQDAFFGLYRNWGGLSDPAKALAYVRSSVLNNCRATLRRQIRRERRDRAAASAAGTALESAEALVLRFYFGLSDEETAAAMGISRGTVKSSSSRALASLGRMLKEES